MSEDLDEGNTLDIPDEPPIVYNEDDFDEEAIFEPEIEIEEGPSELSGQLSNKSEIQDQESSQEGHDPLKIIECKCCSMFFPTNMFYSEHLKEYHHEEYDKCYICNRKFPCRSYLSDHLEKFHRNEPKHSGSVCDICGKIFKSRFFCRFHLKTDHPEQKDFKCQLCDKSYTLKGNLQKHVQIAHEKIRKFKCDYCGKTFGQKIVLQNHIKCKHGDKETWKDLKCQLCDKTYTLKGNLEKHIRIAHDKILPFRCDLCGRSFGQKIGLKRHMKLIHGHGDK